MDETVKTMRERKESLIRKYLSLQDRVDQYNRDIYLVCCEIETLNRKIAEAQNGKNVKPSAEAPPTRSS
ncbi:MAG: hypothetical protein A2Z34_07395 [Planctomycetes bacterium RBG_16_59_8]|nr:MAG: hypothetical protein A2Z34_07395 [Planctomycetes bacterium RBG_16_59_8]